MDVSIIILNYNTFDLTCQCIDSVIKFTQDTNYEIILVDNASTECSPDLFLQKYPNIKLIKSPVNSGFTGGNNLGLTPATGDYVLLVNSDVLLTENSVLKCITTLKNDNSIGVVTCKLKYPNGGIQNQCQRFPSILRTWIELFRIHKIMPRQMRAKVMLNGFFDHNANMDSDSVWGTFFMFPAKLLNKLPDKKLPVAFFMYAEDLLWCFMIKKLGYRVYYLADTSVIHISKGSSAVPDASLRQQNEFDFVAKYYGKLYARIFALSKGLLFKSHVGNEVSQEISGIYFTLFRVGKTSSK